MTAQRFVRHVFLIVTLASSVAHAQPAPTTPTLPTPAETAPAPTTVPVAPLTPLTPPSNLPSAGSARDPRGVVTFDDGLTIATRDDEFALRIHGWAQVRDELDHRPGGFANRIVLPTARLALDGHVLADLDYALSADLGTGTAELRDAYIDRPAFGVRLRIGRFKMPFSRQQLTLLVDQQFTQRAITNAYVGADRDLGASVYTPATVHGGLEWALAVFNGYTQIESATCPSGACGLAPIADHPVGVVRAGWASAHADGYVESDLDGGPPRLAIAANYAIDFARGTAALMRHSVGIDATIKSYGLSLAAAGYLISHRDAATLGRDTGYAGHGQLGYFVVPRHVEVAARYARTQGGGTHGQEALAVVNVFRNGEQAKWQLEGGATQLDTERSWNWLVRLQTQLVF